MVFDLKGLAFCTYKSMVNKTKICDGIEYLVYPIFLILTNQILFAYVKETIKWNGTTSRRKGQKWGREKTIGWSDDQYTCNRGASYGNLLTDEEKHANDQIEFESFFPLTRLPKGGTVSSYDPISENIGLVPVPEQPILQKEDEDAEESPLQADSTLYKEDCTLEIKYTSLLDVRLFEEQNLDSLQNEKSQEAERSNNLAVETNYRQPDKPLPDRVQSGTKSTRH